MKKIVFLGPTLPVEEAREVLDAIYLPPVGQADLISAFARFRPDVVAIVDGVFHQTLSVWHKEILFVLAHGTAVYGASSMGALRAAEMAEFGMVGVGAVYRMYASGEIEDDDEVAVTHGTAESGYRPFSEPMVNIRVTLQAAAEQGILAPPDRDRLAALAKAMPYARRTYRALLAAAAEQEFAAGLLERLQAFLAQGAVDAKRRDALELLARLRDLTPADLPPRRDFHLRSSSVFDALYHRDRSVYDGDQGVPLARVASHAALHRLDFTDLNARALHRGVLIYLADLLGIAAGPEEIQAERDRFLARRSLQEPEDLTAWLAENDLTPAALDELLCEEAVCRALRQWISRVEFKTRNVRLLIDQLRLEGGYAACKREAICLDLLARAEDPWFPAGDADLPLDLLARDHLESTGWDLDADLPQWSEEAGFLSRDHLVVELQRAHLARRGARRLGEAAGAIEEDDDKTEVLRPVPSRPEGA